MARLDPFAPADGCSSVRKGCLDMVNGRCIFYGESDKRDYVLSCEHRFECAIDDAVAAVVRDRDCRMVTLSGPTCSGKTTTANKLVKDLTAEGRKVHVISIDDYYYDRDRLMEIARKNGDEIDFDSPITIDIDTLRRTVDAISEGREVFVPKYDFKSGRRSGFEKYQTDESDTFIFEGIQAVYPNVKALLGGHDYLSIFISVENGLLLDGRCFSNEEIRFYRRLVRDYNFRNASPEFTFNIWESVRENEEENILPNSADCDVRLDSLLPYELSMIKPYLLPLLAQIERDSKYYGTAQRARERLDGIEVISRDFMPENSVYREFLG